MSESSHRPGTTTVTPPAPPGAPPATGVSRGPGPAPGPGGAIPIWVIVAVALSVAAVSGTAVLLWQRSLVAADRSRLAELETTEKQVASATAAATPTQTTSATVAPAPAKPPAVDTTRQLALLKKVTWGSANGYRVSADYVQMLTGKAAADAAAAAGQESPPPNDYFMLNSSTKLRTLLLPKTAPVYVLDWGGASGTTLKKISVGQFMDMMPGGRNPQDQWRDAYYWLTIKNGTTVIRIEQQFLP
jgi:hypothetical protein